MLQEINMSQMLAMIGVSYNTKQVKMVEGDLTWAGMDSVDITENSHTIVIGWKEHYISGGSKEHRLCMTLMDMRKPVPWGHKEKKFHEPILKAYYYTGDNCNSDTQFIYEIMANKIKIIDDIGLVGNGGEYKKKNLLKIIPDEVYSMKLRNEGRWAER